MNITEGLKRIATEYKGDEKLCDAFFVYCVLSDLCHDSFGDINGVKAFFAVNKQVNIFSVLSLSDIKNGLDSLKERYAEVQEIIAFADYKRFVHDCVAALEPNYVFTKKRTAKKKSPAADEDMSREGMTTVKLEYEYNESSFDDNEQGRLLQEADELAAGGEFEEALDRYLQLDEKDEHVEFSIGYCYYVLNDYAKAVYWYKKAAKNGDTIAQYSLGDCYYYGQGVEQDYAKAVYWYKKAAKNGDAYAQYSLGYCYYYGQGVEQDYTKAVEWYTKAAEQGYAAAQNSLGDCYDNGQGVEQDYAKAVYWYKKAAKNGDTNAQNNLGFCYEYGQGVEQDYNKALKFYAKAAKQGNELAIKNKKKLEEKLNDKDKVEANPTLKNYDKSKFEIRNGVLIRYKGKDSKVIIPDGVTSIGFDAFSGCSALADIKIPNGVTSISSFAFKNCTSLTSITIPGSVTMMGGYVFANCTSLWSIYCHIEKRPRGWDRDWNKKGYGLFAGRHKTYWW